MMVDCPGRRGDSAPQLATHGSVKFDLVCAVFEEVVGERYTAGFKQGDGARSTKGEVAPLVPALDRLVWNEGLVDGSDIGSADFDGYNGAEFFCFEGGDDPLVLPENCEIPPEGER